MRMPVDEEAREPWNVGDPQRLWLDEQPICSIWWEGRSGLHNIADLMDELLLNGYDPNEISDMCRNPDQYDDEWMEFCTRRRKAMNS